MTESLKFSARPELREPTLIVGWEQDASKMGMWVTDYLRKKLDAQLFCEIEPTEFFPLNGVDIEEDIVHFPKSNFYACPEQDLIIFQSDVPGSEWFKFLNLILDVASSAYNVKEFYIVGGMYNHLAHTLPRESWATFNAPGIKETLSPYNLATGMDYRMPPGGHPTFGSYLLWVARNRNLEGAVIWTPITFYLVGNDDPVAYKKSLEFFDKRLDLKLDFGGINTDIAAQNNKLELLRQSSPEIDEYIKRLENSRRLTDAENKDLLKAVDDCLKGRQD